jgi:hypothetical protein
MLANTGVKKLNENEWLLTQMLSFARAQHIRRSNERVDQIKYCRKHLFR